MTGDSIIFILMGITLLVLIIGIGFMAVGGKFNQKYSNKLMTLRVFFQALALIMLFILYAYSKK